MSDTLPNQRVEHEGFVYHNQTVKVFDTYGRWKTATKNHRVYSLGDNNWTTDIQVAMLQYKMDAQRSKQ
jgi:hypothetical protein